MRLLECLDSANPAHGGTVESVRQNCLALKALGHRVELLTLDDRDSSWTKKWPGIVHALGCGFTRYKYNQRVKPFIRKNAARFDAIVVNGVWRYLGQGIRAAINGSATPYFVVPHSMLNPWFQERVSRASVSKVLAWKLLEWKVLRDARAVLFTSEQERLLARQTYAPYVCNEDVLSMVGTSIPSAFQGVSTEVLFSQYPHLREKRLILYLGRLHPMKGCDLLINGFATVCAQYPELHLVIAGPAKQDFADGLHTLAKQKSVEDRITWIGPVYGEAKWVALRAASLFALPSHCEAFPVALLEALGCGLPALITDKVNIWNHVSQSQAGFVDTDTIEGTVRSLTKWLSLSNAELDAIRSNALRCFSENFDAKANAIRFLAGLKRHGVNC